MGYRALEDLDRIGVLQATEAVSDVLRANAWEVESHLQGQSSPHVVHVIRKCLALSRVVGGECGHERAVDFNTDGHWLCRQPRGFAGCPHDIWLRAVFGARAIGSDQELRH